MGEFCERIPRCHRARRRFGCRDDRDDVGLAEGRRFGAESGLFWTDDGPGRLNKSDETSISSGFIEWP